MSFHMSNLYDLLRSQNFFFWTAIARFLVSFKFPDILFTVEYSTSPKQYVEYGLGLKQSFGKWIATREKSVLPNFSWALCADVVWSPPLSPPPPGDGHSALWTENSSLKESMGKGEAAYSETKCGGHRSWGVQDDNGLEN